MNLRFCNGDPFTVVTQIITSVSSHPPWNLHHRLKTRRSSRRRHHQLYRRNHRRLVKVDSSSHAYGVSAVVACSRAAALHYLSVGIHLPSPKFLQFLLSIFFPSRLSECVFETM